jgi:hypothetical protein
MIEDSLRETATFIGTLDSLVAFESSKLPKRSEISNWKELWPTDCLYTLWEVENL